MPVKDSSTALQGNPLMAFEAATVAKTEGNAAYSAGNLDLAIERYTAALDHWDEALDAAMKPSVFSVGDVVVYESKGFGRVESAFAVMDEYFLIDLGTDKPVWAGTIGVDLKRFSKSEMQPVPQELFDLRLACTSNLAMVKLKQDDFKLTVRWADEALRMDGKAPKALMRKGKALLADGHGGAAFDVLTAAQQVAPTDAAVKDLLRQAEKSLSPGWICASGCCGPLGLGNNMMIQPTNLDVLGKASKLKAAELASKRACSSKASVKEVRAAGDESDGSSCPGCDEPDCRTGDADGPSASTPQGLPRPAVAAGKSSAKLRRRIEKKARNATSSAATDASCPEQEECVSGKSVGQKDICEREGCDKEGCESEATVDAAKSQLLPTSKEPAETLPALPTPSRANAPEESSATRTTTPAASKDYSRMGAVLLAALAVLVVAWQLGRAGAEIATP